MLKTLQASLGPHQLLLNPQILAQKRIVIKSPSRIILKRLQISLKLLAYLPKSFAPIISINLQERGPLPRCRCPIIYHFIMSRRIGNHSSVFPERLLRLFENRFRKYTDVDASIAGRWNYGRAGYGHHPDISTKGAGCAEELDWGHVRKIGSVVADVEKGGFSCEVWVFFLDLYVNFGFAVEMWDCDPFGLLI
jgi:hypothetical protein